jgi:uncharacterized protein with GYD domain
MAVYIALSNLTDEGRKTLKSNPGRINEVNKEIEAMGVKVLGQYAVLGLNSGPGGRYSSLRFLHCL